MGNTQSSSVPDILSGPPVKGKFPHTISHKKISKDMGMVWEAYHQGGHIIIGGPCKAPGSLTFHLDTCPLLLGANQPSKKRPKHSTPIKTGGPILGSRYVKSII